MNGQLYIALNLHRTLAGHSGGFGHRRGARDVPLLVRLPVQKQVDD